MYTRFFLFCLSNLLNIGYNLKQDILKYTKSAIFSDRNLNPIYVYLQLEIDDGKELTEAFLYDEIHPKRNLHRPAFAKPKGPPNRGAKRITKSQGNQ